MKLQIGVGYTEEWAEQAFPLFEQAGFRLVESHPDPASGGEYLWCTLDYPAGPPLPFARLVELVAKARAVVEASYVPSLDVQLMPDAVLRG